jgi:DNA-directed RNA polymerase specialized sigma24 family protein
MQDPFIKIFKNINNYKNKVAFGAWLKKIVINQSIDHLKKNKLELVSINEEVIAKTDENDWQVDSDISKDEILKSQRTDYENEVECQLKYR